MKIAYLFIAALLAGCLGGCGGDGEPGAEPTPQSETATAHETATKEETTTEADAEASCATGRATVSGQANIFGAGRGFAPGPGGAGILPPSVRLPDGASVVTFPEVAGEVTPRAGERDPNGPGGDGKGKTDINSYDGISGIVHRPNGMFLVGVLLTEKPPSNPAPKRLDFTKNERFRMLAPQVGQTFFIGDGEGRSFRVPRGATRLFLGFADAFSFEKGFYQGDPGYYSNNGGQLCVRVQVARR